MATTTTSTGMPAWVLPYAQGFLQRAQQVADTPYQAYTGQMVAGMTPWQQQGLSAQAQRAMSGSPVMNAANAALPQMFGGGPGAAANPYLQSEGYMQTPTNPYAGSNPYLQQTIDATLGDVTRNWNNVAKPQWDTAMQRSGSFGNSAIAQANQMAQSDMQRNMGNIASQMRMQDYTMQAQLGESAANRAMAANQFNLGLGEQMAGRMDSMTNAGQGRALSALGLAPSFAQQDYTDIDRLTAAGGAYQGMNQRLLDNNYAQFLESRNFPREQLGIMGDALGRSYGTTSTVSQPGASTGAQFVGGLLTGKGLYDLIFSGGK